MEFRGPYIIVMSLVYANTGRYGTSTSTIHTFRPNAAPGASCSDHTQVVTRRS
jgi:hypothetical protein